MNLTKRSLWLAAALLATVGCHTPASGAPDAEDPFLTTPRHAWSGWTPRPATQQLDALAPSLRTFDRWRVEDDALLTTTWDTLFPVLDALRAMPDLPAAHRASLDASLSLLEPGRGGVTTQELLFSVALEGDQARAEVLTVRTLRATEGTVAVAVVTFTRPAGALGPTRVDLWAAPGFAEAPTVEASLSPRELTIDVNDTSLRDAQSAGLIMALLEQRLWGLLTGTSYLEPPFERLSDEQPARVALPAPPEVAERELEHVLSDTAFPPRFESFDFGSER